MRGGTQMFLLLAVFVVQAACQQGLRVTLSPNLPLDQIFSGDSFYLSCGGSGSGNVVKWYLDDVEQKMTNKTWKIAAASRKHSGTYHCESNSKNSNSVNINVLEYLPSASLTILTGQPVMRVEELVVLRLNNEDGLQGWRCWVHREDKTNKIMLRLEGNEVSFDFESGSLIVHETIIWCSDKPKQHRSNQVIVRTSGKPLSLEMYPLPAIEGETLTLRCLVWGTDKISRTVFYKDNNPIRDSNSATFNIPDVQMSAMGSYKCRSTFTRIGRTYGPPYLEESDNQQVLIHSRLIRASLSDNIGMTCSCTLCPGERSYRWYYKSSDRQSWALMNSSGASMMPGESGTYACRAVWNNGRSHLSNGYAYQSPINFLILAVIMVLLILGLAVTALGFYLRYKRRTTEPIYEDVAHTRGTNEYEMLRKTHGAKGGEYDILHPEAGGSQTKDREYQALKKEEMQEGVYHTLQTHEAAGGEGGYQALKKAEMKGGEYQTLNKEGAGGGEEGNEALGKSDKGHETVEEKSETAVTLT